MYQLQVFHPGIRGVQTVLLVEKAADVLKRIPEILAEHDGCETIVVTLEDTRLFSVDCHGNRQP
jgi:hypothetical protein